MTSPSKRTKLSTKSPSRLTRKRIPTKTDESIARIAALEELVKKLEERMAAQENKEVLREKVGPQPYPKTPSEDYLEKLRKLWPPRKDEPIAPEWPDTWPFPKGPKPWEPHLSETSCGVCGMKWDGPMGYVCPNLKCPSRVTCGSPTTLTLWTAICESNSSSAAS